MASAQALPSSRKQEHLEAGKRRLEEFRKKKAAERAKKAASSSQPRNRLETEDVRIIDVDGIGSSAGPATAITNDSSISSNKATEFANETQQVFSNETRASTSFSGDDYSSSSAEFQTYPNNKEIQKYNALANGSLDASYSSGTKLMANYFETHGNAQDMVAYGHTSDHPIGVHRQASQDYDNNSSQSSFPASGESDSKEEDNSLKVSSVVSATSSQDFLTKFSLHNSLQSKPSNVSSLGSDYAISTLHEDSVQSMTSMGGSPPEVRKNMLEKELREPMISNLTEKKLNSTASGFPSMQSTSKPIFESSGLSSDVKNSSSLTPPYPVANDTSSRRSRPSFLDSLNVSRSSSGSPFQRNEPGKDSFLFHSSEFNSKYGPGSSAFQKPSSETETNYSNLGISKVTSVNEKPVNSSVSASNGGDLLGLSVNEKNNMEKRYNFYSPQQNEDFAALEQHIEDLTQEKFSLQRALEASQALAETLAAENSSLTDNYNQQRIIVNQLKYDMEKLQEEIKAQLAEVESFKMEYTNARLECSAADERANILASEVIGLEEKALKLRSNELKLERQLENTQAEISSCKKKMSSLEKERQDLQSTIDALQVEKKVLQSMLRKASSSGKYIDISKNAASRKDMSTSTEDLDTDATSTPSNEEMRNSTSLLGSGASSTTMVPENGELSFENAVNIPHDQMRTIQNINALISELALEKEELTQALSSELSQSSKLKDLNKELSQKLEAQTQRLELLTAQSMASENISARHPDSHTMHENTAFADEGDEVVERVLGWIMKLFPGGPSRRRTSKLL